MNDISEIYVKQKCKEVIKRTFFYEKKYST
jgi:hypothetical protein